MPPVNGVRADAWGPGGPKPIEPDTSIGGIIAACRQLKTRKGDRMAVFTARGRAGRRRSDCVSGDLSAERGPHRERHAGARAREARAGRRVGAGARVGDRAARQRPRAAVAGGGHPGQRTANRDLFEALGEIFSRHRGDRRVSFEIELAAAPKHLRVRADVSSQIRVRPSPALIAEVEQVVGAGSVSLR